MWTLSILKMNVIFDFVMLILIIIPIFIFIWGCLALVWQLVTFLWIINIDFSNIDKECHIWPCRVDFYHYTNFHLYLRLFGILVWQHVTFLWIINEKLIILKTNAIFDLVMLILINIPIFIFIWGCLALVWQLVTFLWIINVDFVNIENRMSYLTLSCWY